MALPVDQVSSLEQKIGRPLTVVKEYARLPRSAFPTSAEQQLMNSGHILHFAWTAKLWSNQKATPSWKDIAAGKDDASVIIPEAKRLAAVKTPFFIDWDHEMDGKTRSTWGTPLTTSPRTATSTRCSSSTASPRRSGPGCRPAGTATATRSPPYYPGNDVVDWIGWDPYNGSVNGWQTPQQVFQTFYDCVNNGGPRRRRGSQAQDAR